FVAEPVQADEIPGRTDGSSGRALKPEHPVGSADHADFLPQWRQRRDLRLEPEDTSGGVAIQCRGRTSQRLDPTQRGDVDVIERGLAIRQRRGDAVDHDVQPPYAELRSGP